MENAIEERLKAAGELSSQALLLMLNRRVEMLEDGDDIPATEVDRLARTVLDRIGYSKKTEVEHSGGVSHELEGLREALRSGVEESETED